VTRNARMALLGAALMVAVLAFALFELGGDDEEPRPAATATSTRPQTAPRPQPPPLPVVELRDGEPVGGVRALEFESGERARFAVASNRREELHLHGYDLTRTVPAGGRALFSFRADAQGAYELESHDTGEQIATVKVVP